MEEANRGLIAALSERLERQADPWQAEAMQAYMKCAMPFAGVRAPAQQRIFGEVFAAHPLANFGAWRATILALAREAQVREERYAASALAGARRYQEYQTLAALPIAADL